MHVYLCTYAVHAWARTKNISVLSVLARVTVVPAAEQEFAVQDTEQTKTRAETVGSLGQEEEDEE